LDAINFRRSGDSSEKQKSSAVRDEKGCGAKRVKNGANRAGFNPERRIRG